MQSDIPRQKFGRLTPIALFEDNTRHRYAHVRWLCVCDCGTVKDIDHQCVRRGVAKSCGCLRRENPNHVTHGYSRPLRVSAEYRAWQGMKDRCFNVNSNRFQYYGGRGVTVCERWKTSFENFIADMGPRPQGMATKRSKFSIDRINNDGDYEPGNCRWATAAEQVRNRSKAA